MVVKVAFVNFKGGVAKTITSVNFAAMLADRGKKVLLIDLDPQSNASLWLLGESRFPRRSEEPEKTVYQLFLDRLPDHDRRFRFNNAVVRAVAQDSHGHSVTPNLDLLPNTYHSIDLERKLMTEQGVIDILKLQLEDVAEQYDFIVYDCAPNLYLTTTNVLLFSNFYVVPVYPDFFSRAGLTILCREVKRIWDRHERFSDDDLELCGVIITRIKENAPLDAGKRVDLETGLNELKADGSVSPHSLVFTPFFNDSVEIARSIEAFVPTIHYNTHDPRIQRYTERIGTFCDEALEMMSVRFPEECTFDE